jgi:hypothetical protein
MQQRQLQAALRRIEELEKKVAGRPHYPFPSLVLPQTIFSR